jgi:hypothetical protein
MYASILGISDASHMDLFDQPAYQLFFSNLLVYHKCLQKRLVEAQPSANQQTLVPTCRSSRDYAAIKNPPTPPLPKGGKGGFHREQIISVNCANKH